MTLLKSKVDPDDIAQETFLAFFELADQGKVSWDREGDLWRLMAGIAVNQIQRKAEFFAAAKRNVGREVAQSEFQIVDGKNADAVAIGQIADLVSVALENEKPLFKRVLTARLAGLTLVEIANRTGRSERTIRRVLQSLKSKLADIYGFQIESDLPSNQKTPLVDQDNFRLSFDDFDLVRMIGAGAFGKVYLARDNRKGETVAIKVLKSSWLGQTDVEAQFLSEAAQLASLDHPNIVEFHGVGPLPNGSWIMVMEHCIGQSLRGFDIDSGKAPFSVNLIHDIVLAISYLHKKGVVHGDLQPGNIMVSRHGVKLIDFGFCCFQTNDSNQRAKLVGGTEGFVAPESRTSTAADVYSIGRTIEFVLDRVDLSLSNQLLREMRGVIEIACDNQPINRPGSSQLAELIREAIGKPS